MNDQIAPTPSHHLPLIDIERLALSDPSEMTIEHKSVDGRPLMIVDNLYADPEYVRRVALSLQYQFSPGQYPGAMAFISIYPRGIESFVNAHYGARIDQTLAIHQHYRNLTFAIINRTGADLNAIQAQPHFDDFCAHAGLIYLNTEEQSSGGTSFWTHRSSGLQSAYPKDYARVCIMQTHADFVLDGYPTKSNKVWELNMVVPMKFNRLILYDSLLFHTPHYFEEDFGETLAERRLGQNLYFNPVGAKGS